MDSFQHLLDSALESSCRPGVCDGEKIRNAYDDLLTWYTQALPTFCYPKAQIPPTPKAN